MQASVLLTLQMNETEAYKVDLNLPIEAPSEAAPFHFSVTQVVSGTAKGKVLDVGIIGSGKYYARVAPPGSLLALAGMEDSVKELAVQVSEGDWLPSQNVAKAIAPSNPKEK